MSAADAPDDGQLHSLLAFRFRRAYRRIVNREHFVRFYGETAVLEYFRHLNLKPTDTGHVM